MSDHRRAHRNAGGEQTAQRGCGFLRGALNPQEQTWLAEAQKVDRTALPEKLRHNLPDWLAGALQRQTGDQFWPLVQALEAEIRLHVELLGTGESLRELNVRRIVDEVVGRARNGSIVMLMLASKTQSNPAAIQSALQFGIATSAPGANG